MSSEINEQTIELLTLADRAHVIPRTIEARMTMKAQRKGPGGWSQGMKLQKLQAARQKWLEKQQAPLRKPDDLQLIANNACLAPLSCDGEGEDQGGFNAQG
jgi:hypothetical protein